MKKLIVLFLFLTSQVFATSSLEQILNETNDYQVVIKKLKELARTDKQAKKLLHDLELYGLITPKAPIFEKAIRPDLEKTKNEIIKKLKTNIHGEYLDSLKAQWGDCESGNCLNQTDDVYKYSFLKRDICLPNTTCGFYKCMEEKYKCDPVGVNYFTELAVPTCSTYVKNINKNYFTKKGIKWIYSVMVCLQKGLIEECDERDNCQKSTRKETCDHITKYTLEFHPSCYLNSGVGVCKLPLKDKINIWRTVAKYLTNEETVQAFRVVFKCLGFK
jgi:hypothetical protein